MLQIFTFETRNYILLRFGKLRIGFYNTGSNVNVWKVR